MMTDYTLGRVVICYSYQIVVCFIERLRRGHHAVKEQHCSIAERFSLM